MKEGANVVDRSRSGFLRNAQNYLHARNARPVLACLFTISTDSLWPSKVMVKVVNGATAAHQLEWHFITANKLCISDAVYLSLNCSIVWEIIVPTEQQGKNSKT